MMDLTLATVLYEVDWERAERIAEENLAAVGACDLEGELIIVDNSQFPTSAAVDFCRNEPCRRYFWNGGYNVYLAGALNQAVSQARGMVFVYFCASHGLVNDRTWLTDLIAPLADPQVGLAGHVQPCEFNRVAAVPEDIIEPQIHVQGGLWAARRDLLKEFGFSHRFPFEYCDVDLSRRLLAGGYRLAAARTIASVAGGTIPDPEHYKYVHDYR